MKRFAKKISKTLKGKPWTEERRINHKIAVSSEESKIKRSKAQKGRYVSEKTKKKIKLATNTPERLEKFRAKMLGRKFSLEQKRRHKEVMNRPEVQKKRSLGKIKSSKINYDISSKIIRKYNKLLGTTVEKFKLLGTEFGFSWLTIRSVVYRSGAYTQQKLKIRTT